MDSQVRAAASFSRMAVRACRPSRTGHLDFQAILERTWPIRKIPALRRNGQRAIRRAPRGCGRCTTTNAQRGAARLRRRASLDDLGDRCAAAERCIGFT